MEDYKAILKMIESVDPNDTVKLDEIDMEVSLYLKPERRADLIRRKMIWYIPSAKYTRTRDALKAIRPKSASITLYEMNNGGGFILGVRCVLEFMNGKKVFSPNKLLPTEELAELHAIIQAIAYERGQ